MHSVKAVIWAFDVGLNWAYIIGLYNRKIGPEVAGLTTKEQKHIVQVKIFYCF
jgi:hypothetical protein